MSAYCLRKGDVMGVRFSLITPIYNISSYLPKCIESMINQSFPSLEIILVDDGSTDDSPEICDTYALNDQRITVIHKQNGGLVSARQAGSAVATGEYIICVDGDDWIEPDYCLKMNEIIEKYTPDVICCGYYKEFENQSIENTIQLREGLYSKQDIQEVIFPVLLQSDGKGTFPTSMWAKATKAALQQQQQQLLDVVMNIGEDIACMVPCIFHSESVFVMKECLYHYRQTPGSMTKGKKVYDWDGPKIRGKHIEKQIDISVQDFNQQVYRSVVISLYTVVRSRFNTSEPFIRTRKDICMHLDDPYYEKALHLCSFKNDKKGLMKLLLLRFRLLWFIKLIG